MKKIYKNIIISIVFCMISLGLSACGTVVKENDKINIVCATFPEYDWCRNIIGDCDSINLILLVNNGVDIHSFQPSTDDIVTLSNCDMVIYGGGESEEWIDDIIAQSNKKDIKIIKLMDEIGDNVVVEEIVEGMETDEEDDEHSEEVENDEHIWLSIKNSIILCNSISSYLCEIDEENNEIYIKNKEYYVSLLNKLDEEYKSVINESKYDTIIVGDRFPLVYLFKDYSIDYFAAFVGCSAETEASFETVTFLANKLSELNLPAVLVIEGSDCKFANTIVESSSVKDAKILEFNSMQSITENDINAGKTYISIMEQNLESIRQALND